MSKTITRHCDQCQDYQEVEMKDSSEIKCPHCSASWGKILNESKIFEHCPICQCRKFYLAKDYDKFICIFVIFVGAILTPMTYGISIFIAGVIVWKLYKRIKNIANCYRCGAEFRGFDIPSDLKPFNSQIGGQYDKYKGKI